MTDKDIFSAIMSRDLAKVSEMIHTPQCSDCNDTQRVERNIDGCDVEVECVMCSPQYGLRARLSLEQRDSQERCGANTWQDRDADEYGVNRTGPI